MMVVLTAVPLAAQMAALMDSKTVDSSAALLDSYMAVQKAVQTAVSMVACWDDYEAARTAV